jgi:hypothetical protein
MLMGKVLEQPWLHSRTSGQHQDLLLKAASAGKSGRLSWGFFFFDPFTQGPHIECGPIFVVDTPGSPDMVAKLHVD